MGIPFKYAAIVWLFFFAGGLTLSGQVLVINEFMSRNESTLADADGDFTDWIEIWNGSDEYLSLESYGLSDDSDQPYKWIFPDVSISPKSFILVFASGKDKNGNGELHASFKIDGDGEELLLTGPDGRIVDFVAPVPLKEDEVFGRLPDGGLQWSSKLFPTPGRSNVEMNQLSYSHPGGFYTEAFKLEIHSANGDTVRYKLNGKEPGVDGEFYRGAIPVQNIANYSGFLAGVPSTPPQSSINYKAWEMPSNPLENIQTITFASFKDEQRTSDIYTASYFVDEHIRNRYAMPVISLVTNPGNLIREDSGIYVPGDHFDPRDPQWTGNYFQRGRSWERPVHIEYYETDGRKGFAQEAGMRIHGLMTRQAAQKTLRLYARESYGEEAFSYPLLPGRINKQYKRFLLRSTMGSWSGRTVICDGLAREFASGLHMDSQDYRPVIVYINGEYWGIHTIIDRIDEHYIAYVSGFHRDSVDLIGGNYRIVDAGTNAAYMELAEYIQEHDLSVDSHYRYVAEQVELESLVDYMILEFFFANRDWPGNNQKCWRPHTPGGKWRWILFDVDAGFGDPKTDLLEQFSPKSEDPAWQTSNTGTFLFKNLLKHPEFENLFISRFTDLLKTRFIPAQSLKMLQEVKIQYDEEIARHIDRWAYPSSPASWERDIYDELLTFFLLRPCQLASQLNMHFDAGIDMDCPDFPQENNFLMVAPNPNSGHFSILNKSDQAFFGRLLMTSVDGRLITANEHVFIGANEQLDMNQAHLGAGVYLLYLLNALQLERLKVVIVN